MWAAADATTVDRPELSPEEKAEMEVIAAQVLAEAPPESWPRKPLRNLLQRGREQKLNRAYVRGIIDGAFSTRQRLAADPTMLDRWVAAVNAGQTPDLGMPNAAFVLDRTDYADTVEWLAAIERYQFGFYRALLALFLARVRAGRTP